MSAIGSLYYALFILGGTSFFIDDMAHKRTLVICAVMLLCAIAICRTIKEGGK